MPIKLHPPRPGRPHWTARGTYLHVFVNRSTGARERKVAQKVVRQIEDAIERGRFSRRGEATFASATAAYLRAGGERRFVKPLLLHFGNTPLSQIDQAAIDAAAVAIYPDALPATRNRQLYSPISAIRRQAGNTSTIRRPKGSAGNKQTAWLWPEQAQALIGEAEKTNKDFAALLIVLLYTGMRLSEALELAWNDVRLQEGFCYVPDTKNGEPRPVFLPPVAVAAMGSLDAGGESCFRFAKGGHLYSLLKAVAFRAGVDLPRRSAFHILRHTYATWMRRYAGVDEAGLMATGAWKDRKSVARYTHTVVSEESRKAELLPTMRRIG